MNPICQLVIFRLHLCVRGPYHGRRWLQEEISEYDGHCINR